VGLSTKVYFDKLGSKKGKLVGGLSLILYVCFHILILTSNQSSMN
jgi:hypothetical protein